MTAPAVLEGLLQLALRGAGIGLLALLVVQLARRWSAASRHAVITGALVAQLGLFLLPLISLPYPIPVPAPVNRAIQATDGLVASAIPAQPTRAEPARSRSIAPALLLLLMAAGSAGLSLRLLRARARLSRLRGELLSAQDTSLPAEVAGEAAALGIRNAVPVRLGSLPVPVVAGILRPEILMPVESLDWPEERRRRALRHELAHVVRRDLLILHLAQVVRAIWWWNPAVWLLVYRLRSTAERAADDMVIAAGQPTSAYVDDLIALVREAPVQDGLAPVGFAMARRSEFEGRMLALMDQGMGRGGLSRRVTVSIALVSGAAVLALPMTRQGALAGNTVTAQAPADSSEAGLLLELARTTAPPVERSELLGRAILLPLTAPQVDQVLRLVVEMGDGIPAGVTLRRLVQHHQLSPSQAGVYLSAVSNLTSPVELSTSLAELARRHDLTGEPRRRYLQLTADLPDGPARRTALDALR